MKVRVAIAQIETHPAYMTNLTDLAMEPTGQDLNLGALGPLLGNVRSEAYSMYLEQLQIRLDAIVKYCAKNKTDVLVLPEYAVPPELLPYLWRLAAKTSMYIVAGSHSVSSRVPHVYEQAGLQVGYAGSDSDIRKGMCPIFCPDGNTIQYFKMQKSQWEAYLVESKADWTWRTITIRGEAVSLGIFLCIDALRAGQLSDSPSPPLVVVPSRSPSTDEFEDFSRLQLINETSVAYVNDSETGNSKIYGVFGTTNSHPYMDKDGTKPLPPKAEAVVIADLNLDGQYVRRRTVRTAIPMELVAMAPLLYTANTNLRVVEELLSLAIQDGTATGVETCLTCNELPGLLHDKIRWLQQLGEIGGIRPEDTTFYLSVVEIPSPGVPFAALEYHTLSKYSEALLDIASKLKGEHRTQALRCWERVKNESEKRVTLAAIYPLPEDNQTETPPTTAVEAVPFQDRETATASARHFSNDPSKSILIVYGLRGIGKTRFCENTLQNVFPNRKVIQSRLTEGTGFPRFIHGLAASLDVELTGVERVSVDDETVYVPLMKRILQAFDELPAAVLLLDDWHFVLRKDGYRDPRFRTFLDYALIRPTYRNNKILLTSRQKFPLGAVAEAAELVELYGLDDDSIRGIIDWHVKSQRGDAEPIHIPQALIAGLHGNPLAAVIVATQWIEQTPASAVVDWPTVQERFQERLVPELLEHTDLDPEEEQVMGFAALFNTEIPYEVFALCDYPGDLTGVLSSLMDKFLLEFRMDTQAYRVHGLVRDYFRNRLPMTSRINFHKRAADYYEGLAKESSDPLYKGELVAHLAASLQYEKARELRNVYYDELRPVALDLFREKQYEESLKYYEALRTFYPDDPDVHFHITLCNAHLGRWDKAEVSFDTAVRKTDNPWWMYAGYADVMIKYRLGLFEAEKYLLQALELAQKAGAKRWKLSAVYESLGKIHMHLHRWPTAETYLRTAVDHDPESGFPHYQLAKCLWQSGKDPRDALAELDLAMTFDRTIEASQRLRDFILGAQAPEHAESDDDVGEANGLDPDDSHE